MNYRKKIRKAIECPQLGNETYGEFGILNLTQRKYIKRLLDELDNADNFVKKLYFENKQLKDNWNKLKEYLNYKSERAVGEDEYVYDEIYNEMQELEKGNNYE